MRISLRLVLFFTALTAIYTVLLTSQSETATKIGESLSIFVIGLSIAVPFGDANRDVGFWSTYSILTGLFLLLLMNGNSSPSEILTQSYFDGSGVLFRLLGFEIEYFEMIRFFRILKYFSAPTVGILAAFLIRFLVGRTPAKLPNSNEDTVERELDT